MLDLMRIRLSRGKKIADFFLSFSANVQYVPTRCLLAFLAKYFGNMTLPKCSPLMTRVRSSA